MTLSASNKDNNKHRTTQEKHPWIHPATITESLRIYRTHLPEELYRFQSKLCRQGKLSGPPTLPGVHVSANAIVANNLKLTIKEALSEPDQSHWQEAICTEMEGLESMSIWEVVDMPQKAHLVDSRLVLNVKTDANGIPYKFKA